MKLIIPKILIIIFLLQLAFTTRVFAVDDDIQKLNNQIEERRNQIEALDKEIAKQRAALNSVSGTANNLQSTVNQLEATKKKLLTGIDRTEAEISRAELTLKRLDLEIIEKEHFIEKNSAGLAESIRRNKELEEISVIEKFLQFEKMSEFWVDFEATEKLQSKLKSEVETLELAWNDLRNTQNVKFTEKENLSKQKTILAGESEVVKSTQAEKAALLKETKNKEAEYQRLLNIKLSEKRAFEEELMQIESKLKFIIDPSSLPKFGRGVLGWPLDIIRVTQEFGGTAFAKNNPGLYKNASHNGTDFGTPVGSKVLALESGVIEGFDNTDAYPGCRSWGRWLLIKYDNGLASLYGHLSGILVKKGQRVSRGEVVALSGNTGISTGPHLHVTIYAAQGVSIKSYKEIGSTGPCAQYGATSPFASLDAYYNPMSYLPSL